MNRYLRLGLLFFMCLLLFTIPEPGVMRDMILGLLFWAVLILIPLHLIFTDKTYTDPHPALSYWIIGIAGALLTGIFWFRLTSGSYGFETGFTIRILKTFFFWTPAALFAVLYRSGGEGWIPGKRSAILTRLLVSVIGSLAGLAASEFARSQIDSIPLENALIYVERQLPDGKNRIEFRHESLILHLEVILDSSFTEPNIHSLQRLRAIAGHAANLTGRKDTDSLNLHIRRNDKELATLSWPDPATNRPANRLHINYIGTELSDLPTSDDLDLLFGTVQEVFRPKNLSAVTENTSLVLRWMGDLQIPGDPSEIPDITHDWQAAGHVSIRAAALFEGLKSILLHMPGHSFSVAADNESLNGAFRFQQLLPIPDVSSGIQIFDDEEMPELTQAADSAPVMIYWGDGEFDTRHNRTGPLWPWEKATLAGYQFHIIELEEDGSVHFVIHPLGRSEEARWMKLQRGQTQQLDSLYIRVVKLDSFN